MDLQSMNTKASVLVSWLERAQRREEERTPPACLCAGGRLSGPAKRHARTRALITCARSAHSSWHEEERTIPPASDDLEPHDLSGLLRRDRRDLLRLIVRDADEAPITSVRVGRDDLDTHGPRHEGARQIYEIVDLSVARKRRI